MCVSSPVNPMIIGNVRGTRQMLPDPDWMPDDQRGARAPKKEDSENKPAHLKKIDNHATQDVIVQEGTILIEGKCVAGKVLMRAQAKKSDKIHPLKVKGAMSNVDKSIIEDFQMTIL